MEEAVVEEVVVEGAVEAVEAHRWADQDGEDHPEDRAGHHPQPEQYSRQQETTSCSETHQEFSMETKLKRENS